MIAHKYGWRFGLAAFAGALLTLPVSLDRVVAHEDGRIVFKLSDLKDGETRTFGEGKHEITATRKGDVVAIALGEDGAAIGAETIDCDLAGEDCRIVVSDGGETIVLSTSDVEWNDADAGRVDLDEKHVAVVVAAEGDEDDVHRGVRVIKLRRDGAGEDQKIVIAAEGGASIAAAGSEAQAFAFWTGKGGKMLRCPEGDTTMVLEEGDEERDYRCPKHDLPLREAAGKVSRKVKVVTTTPDEE